MIKVSHLKIESDYLDNRQSKAFQAFMSIQIDPTQELVNAIKSGKIEGISYKLVGTVKTTNLETAFRLTNSVDSYWCTGSEVTVVGDDHRSTSVGDLMEKDGEFFVVAMIGFNAVKDLELA